MNIGDRCVTKKTGNLSLATLIGVVDSRTYNQICYGYATAWDDLYPDWRDKPIGIIEFDKPQKNITFEEFCNKYKEDESFQDLENKIKNYYYEKVPPTFFVSAPMDDLEEI